MNTSKVNELKEMLTKAMELANELKNEATAEASKHDKDSDDDKEFFAFMRNNTRAEQFESIASGIGNEIHAMKFIK